MAERLQRHLREHLGEAPQHDDRMLMVFGVTAGASVARRRRRDVPTQTFEKSG